MSKNFAIIGGDLRIVKLSRMLAEDGNMIRTFGIENAEELRQSKNIILMDSIDKATEKADIVIAPVPFSKNGTEINTPFSNKKILIEELINKIQSKILIAGSIKKDIYNKANEKNIKIFDIMEMEEVAILNAISTAEGAIEIAIANTQKTLHGSDVLILGFGRIGKILAKKLKAFSSNVTCAARKNIDFAWIKALGYTPTNINELGENLGQYDLIINTVPVLILNRKRLQNIRRDCLIIDLASCPGGIDFKEAEKKSIKCIWALALPGKVAPISSAEILKENIYSIIERNNLWK